ncbi:MAG: FprA family A-type flavoprotein [Bacteroidales bacterium]|nr:FprA family A-type flavoprotein [Bacteroidales bacterium]MBR5670639.1 FprA family A-type flavoprotein [Bacteroidales bacterium]
MKDITIGRGSVKYIGVDDLDIDLFESQYIVPEGMAYNSYVILDDKVAIMDGVDDRKAAEWEAKLYEKLGDRTPDYIVVLHTEPDHSGSIARVMSTYPMCRCICSNAASKFMQQFYPGLSFADRIDVVKEGDMLQLGAHTLRFFAAPMVHWPDVLVAYEESEKILFSADAFGKFGALSKTDPEDWDCEARRYYINICGKFGPQVQALLKKLSGLEVATICPLHGPILDKNLGYYINLYDTWSSYRPETEGVFIAYASLHGNTAKAAQYLADKLEAKGVKLEIADLSRSDLAENIEGAFRYDRIVLAAATYEAGLHPLMSDFLHHLKGKGFCNRKVALIENGTWAPMAAKVMKAELEQMKDITLYERVVTIRSAATNENLRELDALTADLTA